MFDGKLTEAEAALVLAAAQGVYGGAGADTAESDWPVVRAEVIRRLLLGLPVFPNGGRLAAVPLVAGIRARGIRIKEPLDLTDAQLADGSAVQPLVLEGVVLPALIAPHARFARLALTKARFAKIDLDGAEIGGDVDLSGARAFEDGGECVVTARNARIDGAFTMRRASLKYTPRAKPPPDEPARYALDLSGSEVDGSLMLAPEFVADGGIRLVHSKIGADVWLGGAKLSRGEAHAFMAESARISGHIFLRNLKREDGSEDQFVAKGAIWLLAARVGGGLYMEGASLDGLVEVDFPDKEAPAIAAGGCEIGGDASLTISPGEAGSGVPFVAKGTVWFNNAKIGGHLDFSGARITAAQDPALSLQSASVGRHVFADAAEARDGTMHRTETLGSVDLQWAEIGANVDLSSTRIEGHGTRSVNAEAVKISGSTRASTGARRFLPTS